MNILIVGAGAVGSVYGRHLSLGGADISFFVKEKHAAELKNGLRFYEMNDKARRHTATLWSRYHVITALDDLKTKTWDYVILSMSSTALRSGWLKDFVPAINASPIVTLQPGMLDRDYLSQYLPADRLIGGTIPIVSYHSPLPGEKKEEAFVYWIPPGGHIALSGKNELVKPLIHCFQAGKITAKQVETTEKLNIAEGPSLTLIVRALELSNWSFEKLKNGEWLKIACEALPEAIRIQAHKAKTNVPGILWLLKPTFFKALLSLSRVLVPFDFEAYLKVHFTKVQDQMHENIATMIAYGTENGISVEKLKKLKI